MPDRSWDSVLKKRDNIVTRQIAGESILVPIRGKLVDLQKIFCLDPVAAFIWERLDGTHPLAQIRDAVLDTFEVQRERAEADLNEFVTELLDAQLIEEAP